MSSLLGYINQHHKIWKISSQHIELTFQLFLPTLTDGRKVILLNLVIGQNKQKSH